jgi:hypothetical protein
MWRWHAIYRWKALDEGYNFVSYLTSIGGFAQKVMDFQNHKSPNFRNFGTPNLRILGQNDIWVQAMWPGIKNNIRGEVMVSSSLGHGKSCEFVYAHASFVHQECYNYALTNLLFGSCRPMWIVNPHVIHPSPYLRISARFSYPQSVAS